MASASNERRTGCVLQETVMLESEKFAIAAHLHVVLRRVNGRVTDVEWMIKSPEYAREIIRVARTETHPDLHKLADKLEAALQPVASATRLAKAVVPSTQPIQPARPAFPSSESGASSGFNSTGFAPSGFDAPANRKRYVGTLR
jgi:hypothetical protein